MEPFELALSQVNFEGNDLTSGSASQPLHSFSNLVSYDSDFNDGATGRPVTARRVVVRHVEGETGPERIAASFYPDYSSPHRGGLHAHTHLVNGSDSVTVEPDETARMYYSAGPVEDGLSSNDGTPKRKVDKGTDSFRGFTETVEALALQKSVIGSASVTPASAEEVARVIAMTQMKMKAGDSEAESDTLAEEGSAGSLPLNDGSDVSTQASHQLQASIPNQTEDSTAYNIPAASASETNHIDPLPGTHGVHGASPMETPLGLDNHFEEPDAAAAASREDAASTLSSSSHQRTASTSSSELIPIPHEMITKVTERKGWLSGRSVISPEQSRPRDRLPLGETAAHAASVETADNQGVPSPAGQEKDPLHVLLIHHEEMQSQTVIAASNGVQGNEARVIESVPEGSLADISGVEKLKGEYDFDTNSYLETMQTFTSLHKTNGTLGEESGTARFSPPVKDPGMLPSERRGVVGRRNITSESTKDSQETLQVLPDEHLILPFHVPVDTSTPSRPISGQGDGSHQRDMTKLSKRQVIIDESETSRVTRTSVSENHVTRSHQDFLISNTDAMSFLDQDITDKTPVEEESVHIHLTSSQIMHDISHVTHHITETSSMVVNVDDVSRQQGRLEESAGDLSLGNSSAAAGEGAELTKSERASFYQLQEEVKMLQRDKAHLEGKIEVLESEASVAIKERSELQSRLASVSTHLKSQEDNTKVVMGDRNALYADLETLKQNRQRLELVVMDAQKLIEEKDQDLKTLHEDLKLAHAANEKTQEKLKDHRHELMARDETIQALKNKVAELYVEYQNSQQTKLLAENEIKSLESSVASLTSAKEWYQGQLSRAQDTKGELQQEISRIQGESITALTLVERLKADNVRIKQSLAEQQQRALQEKELLARHLEAIESDMMEREAAFLQMQQDQVAMESAMKQEEERLRQAENEPTNSEDLKNLQNELRRKQAQANVLEHEQKQLLKRLTLSQESLLERDRTIDRLDQKYVDIELSYKNLQKELDARDEEVLKLKNEKNALEIELASTQEEKQTFDVALHAIKDDMGKVESGFKQLKQELAGRTEELHQALGDKDKLDRQLSAARARIRVLTHRNSPLHTSNNNQEEMSETFDLAPVHHEAAEEEGPVVKIVQTQLEGSKPEVVILTRDSAEPDTTNQAMAELDNAVIEQLQTQRDELDQQFQQLQAENEQLKQTMSSQTELQLQIADLNDKLAEAQKLCQVVTEERTAADTQLVQSKERLTEMEAELHTLTQDKESLQQMLKEERMRLQGEAASAASDAVEEREAIMQLNKENAMLRSKVNETEKQMNKEVTKLRGKVLQVTEVYEARLDDERSRQVDYQAAISELNQRLRDSEQTREQLASELQTLQERFNLSLDEQKLHLQEQTQALHKERESVEEEKQTMRTQINEVQASLMVKEETIEILRTKISEIEVQHREAREQLEESERLRREEDARHLSLDLEREKGRLAGVVQSHTALKEHATSLEAALARREASVAGLSTHVQGELQKRDKQVHELREQMKEMEAEVAKEKQNVKDIKKQLMTEKGQHIKLRRQMETLWVEQDQVKVDLQTRTNQLNLTTLDLEKLKHTNKQLKADVDRLAADAQAARQELEKLKRDALEYEQKEPVLKEQIQTLEWQLQQRTLEVDALKEQLHLAGERQNLEVDNLNKKLQSVSAELMVAKEEMVTLRQDKLALTTKVSQIKTALKATASTNKKRREQKEAELKTLPFDMEALERLLVDTAPVSVQSKPLSFLKATLSGLRGEISNLQQQVDQHTNAVQTSTQAWKELEGHVQELREVCKTSAAGRAAATGGAAVLKDESEQLTPPGPTGSPPPPSQSQQNMTSVQSSGGKTPIVDV